MKKTRIKSEKDKALNLKKKDLKILNSKIGMKHLFRQEKLDLEHALEDAKFELKLRELQTELIRVQKWVIENKKKLLIIFEGRDAAGKGGAINSIVAHINPRHYRKVALNKPTEDEKGQWYFQRYVNHLPKPGEMVFFDRSWYNRAVVEPVNGFCNKSEYKTFMGQVNEFERMLLESEIIFFKFFLDISKEEQAKRIKKMKTDPLKNWRLTEVDLNAQKLWDKYSEYEEKMFTKTDTRKAPWLIIDAEKRSSSILNTLETLLKKLNYK